MGRASRIINYTCTNKQTWYKVFDVASYKDERIQEIKVKLRETSTEDHFRYAYEDSPSAWMTSTSGFTVFKYLKQLYAYMPNNDAEVLEIEIIYK